MYLINRQNYPPNSQSAILRKNVIKCIWAFVVGTILLVVLFLINNRIASFSIRQIENVYFLSQYRLGSKNLTIATQAYVASADEVYWERYEEELNVIQNRERAIAGLEENKLDEEQLEKLHEISALSDRLVPVEEQAFAYVQAGDIEAAKQLIFSAEYVQTIDDITSKTNALMDEVLYVLDRQKQFFRMLQKIIEAFFASSLFILFMFIVRTIRFARKEILAPVVKVSEQMKSLAKGDLHQPFDLLGDDTEVGTMICAIHELKKQWTDMIQEISDVLSEMSNGNFTVQLKTVYVGEFEKIRESVNMIVDQSQLVLRTVQQATMEINQGATQLAEAADVLAAGCTTQAAEISDIIMYMDEVRQEIFDDEKDAEEAKKIADLSNSTLTVGKERIEGLRARIEQAITQVKEINQFVDVLDNDAGETSDAAKNIYQLVENTVRMMDDIVEITAVTNHELEDVMVGSEEMTQRIDRIVSHLLSGVTMTESIVEKMNEIAGVVDNNSATSQETAAISEEQKGQVESLVEILSDYTL